MPKIVDKAQRQEMIANAVWRVAAAEGLHRATVRRVAEEADLSVGSLRRFFPTQASLYEYAMALIIERLESRLSDVKQNGQTNPVEQIVNLLKNFLPLQGEQKAEMGVWLSFSAEAQHNAALKSLNDSMFDRTRNYIVLMLQQLAEMSILAEGLDPNKEAVDLHALLDGLTLHRLMRPEKVTEPEAIDALRSYLEKIIVD